MSRGRRARARARAGGPGPSLVAALLLAGCGPDIPERVSLELVQRETLTAEAADRPSAVPERIEGLTFRTPSGDTVQAFLRRPEAAREPRPAVVLVAGRETGREAARAVPGPLDVVVLSVEYPDAVPERLELGALLGSLPEIRRTALRMPGILRSAAHFLAAEPEVDAERIALVGVSFGVPFAAAAGVDPIFRGVALHHGGGDLRAIFERNLPLEGGPVRGLAARFLAWWFAPLDPARHVAGIGPTPLLLVNGSEDRVVPRSSALLLAERATGPVRHVWLPHAHLLPGDTALMRELADSTLAHFDFLRPDG